MMLNFNILYLQKQLSVMNMCGEYRDHVKVLCKIAFDHKLICIYHVDELCRNAQEKISVLAPLTKTLGVVTFSRKHIVRVRVLLTSMVLLQQRTKKIEKTQKQALRYVFNDFN